MTITKRCGSERRRSERWLQQTSVYYCSLLVYDTVVTDFWMVVQPPPKSRRMRWAGHVARRGRRQAFIGFWWGNRKERDHLEESAVDGRIILRWIFRKWDVGDVDWIELDHVRDRWRELVNVVMNLRVP